MLVAVVWLNVLCAPRVTTSLLCETELIFVQRYVDVDDLAFDE